MEVLGKRLAKSPCYRYRRYGSEMCSLCESCETQSSWYFVWRVLQLDASRVWYRYVSAVVSYRPTVLCT